MFNFLRTGAYGRVDGYVFKRILDGGWWSNIAKTQSYSHYFNTFITGIDMQGATHRGYGFAIRCVTREG